MEIGAVLGAAPRRAVVRENSDPGDIIILLGGRTGRDGCGGATGSSKVHTTESIETCGAEVQKGNAPTERKLQRLFRREEVSLLIKNATTSVQAEFPLPSASWHRALRSIWTKYRKNMPASTELRSPSPSPRSVWPLSSTRKTVSSS